MTHCEVRQLLYVLLQYFFLCSLQSYLPQFFSSVPKKKITLVRKMTFSPSLKRIILPLCVAFSRKMI